MQNNNERQEETRNQRQILSEDEEMKQEIAALDKLINSCAERAEYYEDKDEEAYNAEMKDKESLEKIRADYIRQGGFSQDSLAKYHSIEKNNSVREQQKELNNDVSNQKTMNDKLNEYKDNAYRLKEKIEAQIDSMESELKVFRNNELYTENSDGAEFIQSKANEYSGFIQNLREYEDEADGIISNIEALKMFDGMIQLNEEQIRRLLDDTNKNYEQFKTNIKEFEDNYINVINRLSDIDKDIKVGIEEADGRRNLFKYVVDDLTYRKIREYRNMLQAYGYDLNSYNEELDEIKKAFVNFEKENKPQEENNLKEEILALQENVMSVVNKIYNLNKGIDYEMAFDGNLRDALNEDLADALKNKIKNSIDENFRGIVDEPKQENGKNVHFSQDAKTYDYGSLEEVDLHNTARMAYLGSKVLEYYVPILDYFTLKNNHFVKEIRDVSEATAEKKKIPDEFQQKFRNIKEDSKRMLEIVMLLEKKLGIHDEKVNYFFGELKKMYDDSNKENLTVKEESEEPKLRSLSSDMDLAKEMREKEDKRVVNQFLGQGTRENDNKQSKGKMPAQEQHERLTVGGNIDFGGASTSVSNNMTVENRPDHDSTSISSNDSSLATDTKQVQNSEDEHNSKKSQESPEPIPSSVGTAEIDATSSDSVVSDSSYYGILNTFTVGTAENGSDHDSMGSEQAVSTLEDVPIGTENQSLEQEQNQPNTTEQRQTSVIVQNPEPIPSSVGRPVKLTRQNSVGDSTYSKCSCFAPIKKMVKNNILNMWAKCKQKCFTN